MTRGKSESRERKKTINTGVEDEKNIRIRAGYYIVLILVIEIRRVGLYEKSWDISDRGESWGFWYVIIPKSPHGLKIK